MKYIGMDAHSSTCRFSVVDGLGQELDNVNIATNGRLLVNYLKSIEGPKQLTFEECELSQWLYGILNGRVEKLVVCNPVANREYKRAKTDKLDARRLAQLLRGGFLRGVYHDGSKREQLRSLMSGYQDMVEEGVRLKNRYKSLFRKSGKRMLGTSIYEDEDLLEGLKREDFKFIGVDIFKRLESLEESREKYLKEIRRCTKRFEEISLLKTIPGIGELHAARIVSQVIDPKRFKTKYKYYSYCGLVRHKRESGGRSYGTEKIHGNQILKSVYKLATETVLRMKGSGFRRYYEKLLEQGVEERNARNAVSRKLAAVSLGVWKRRQEFNEEIVSGLIKEPTKA